MNERKVKHFHTLIFNGMEPTNILTYLNTFCFDSNAFEMWLLQIDGREHVQNDYLLFMYLVKSQE